MSAVRDCYRPHLEAVSHIRNLSTRHAAVTGDPLNMDDILFTAVFNGAVSSEGFGKMVINGNW
jgi:hypothetical protein